MKIQSFVTVVALVAFAFAPRLAQAVPPSATGSEGKPDGAAQKEYPPRMLDWDKLKEPLGLTDGQLADLKAYSNSQKAKIDAIREDNSLTHEQKKEKLREVKKSGKAEMEKILTPEQLKKLKELRPKGPKGPEKYGDKPKKCKECKSDAAVQMSAQPQA